MWQACFDFSCNHFPGSTKSKMLRKADFLPVQDSTHPGQSLRSQKILDLQRDQNKVMRQLLANQNVQISRLIAKQDNVFRAQDAAINDCLCLQRQLDETNLNSDLVVRVSVVLVGGIKTALLLVDAKSFVNVIPESLLHCLGLTSQVANKVILNMGGSSVLTSQYYRLEIWLAGIKITIDAIVVHRHKSYI